MLSIFFCDRVFWAKFYVKMVNLVMVGGAYHICRFDNEVRHLNSLEEWRGSHKGIRHQDLDKEKDNRT